MADQQPIIFDNGSGFTKCGMAGENAPRVVFPSVVGRPKSPGIMVGMDAKDCFIGEEAKAKRGILKLKYPVEHGMVTNWNDMDRIWRHSFFDELHVTPDDHPVFVTEVPLNPRNNREKTVSIMFETFNVPALYIGNHAVCSLLASGRSTGLVVESGDGVTHCCPVYEGHDIGDSVRRMNIAGRDVLHYLVKILAERGYEMTTSAEYEIVCDIKEKLCYVAVGFEKELERSETTCHCEREYELPDESRMTIGSERFRAPEILFQPSLIGDEVQGLPYYVHESITTSDPSIQNTLFSNIVLSGGNSQFEGFPERVKMEVKEHAGADTSPLVEVITPTACSMDLFAWRGASVMSCLSSFGGMWILKEEYDEAGATIVHRKCF